jgi:hypothetical protein
MDISLIGFKRALSPDKTTVEPSLKQTTKLIQPESLEGMADEQIETMIRMGRHANPDTVPIFFIDQRGNITAKAAQTTDERNMGLTIREKLAGVAVTNSQGEEIDATL